MEAKETKLIVDRQYLWFIDLCSEEQGDLDAAIRTAVSLAQALAAKNGVYVKAEISRSPILARVDEILLMQSIVDTILGSSKLLGPGSVLYTNCSFTLHDYTLSFSVRTEMDVFYPRLPERLMQDVIERAYLETVHSYADFYALAQH